LRKGLKNPATFKTHSDCEVIMHLVSVRKALDRRQSARLMSL
jgi:asparagine synthetase B (glutamine-hydrolysing)